MEATSRTYAYAGLGEVFRVGLSVPEVGERIRRFAYVEERLMFLQAAHFVSVPQRDFKTLLARLQFEDGRHANLLRERMGELRLPKGSRHEVPDEALNLLMDEALHARGEVEVVAAVRFLKSRLRAAYEKYLQETNPLADSPSVQMIKTILNQEREVEAFLEAAYQDIVSEQQDKADSFVAHLEKHLSASGGLDGTAEKGEAGPRERSILPHFIAHELARDESLGRVWDFVAPPQSEVGPHLAHMMAIRLSEVNVAEGLGIVLCETPEKPWEFYQDISRHLWDEVRHSLMGEAAIEATLGDRAALPMRDYEGIFCMEAPPLEQYATLGLEVEGANMKYPIGKRGEWEFCKDMAQHPLMTTFQDFDWADEVLHVNIARAQLSQWFEGGVKALAQFGKDGKAHRTQIKTRHQAVQLPDVPDILERGRNLIRS